MITRAKVQCGLVPNRWVVLAQKEEHPGDPNYNDHHLLAELFCDAGYLPATLPLDIGNQQPVEVLVQESNDGVTWRQLWRAPNPIVPGGRLTLDVYHSQLWVRICLFSTGTGRVDAVIGIEEPHTVAFWPDVTQLSCSTFCEVDCETGTETAG